MQHEQSSITARDYQPQYTGSAPGRQLKPDAKETNKPSLAQYSLALSSQTVHKYHKYLFGFN